MTIKKDGTICVLKVWIRNVKKWKLELIYVFAHKMCGYGQFLWVCNWPWWSIWSMSPSLYLQVSGWSFYRWWKTSVTDLSISYALMWHLDNSSLLKLLSLSCCDKGFSHFTHFNHHILTQVFIFKYFCIKLFFKSIKLIPFPNLTWLGLSTSVVYYFLEPTFNLINPT